MTSEPSNFGSLFHTDCLFGTLDEVKQWVNNHGRTLGYVFVTKRSKKNERLGIKNTAYLVCDRGGEYKSTTESTTHSGTKRIGCPFKLVAKYHPRESGWKIRVVCDEHNHEPAKYMEGHAYAKRLSREELHMVKDMTKKNMQPRDILTALKENNKDNVSTIETIYQARQKIRLSNQIGTTPMQSLFGGLHNKGYVHEFRTDQYNQLEDLFFINPTSMDIWRAFPHVLIMDATYNTNKYRLPFLHCLSHAVISTYFPLWKGPLELANYRIITIAHVHGDHFVSVRLQGLYPMPMITTLWSYHRNENASGWETMFWEQLERYRDYLSRNSHTEYINID